MNISKEINVETVNKISKVLINSQVEPNEFPPLSLEVALIECCNLNENGNKPPANPVPESAPVVKNENGNKPPANKSIINNEWKSVCNSLRRVKGNKYFIGGLLNSVSPVINEGKINLIFKSNTMKQNFLSEIANHETKQKVMDSIKDNYNESLELIVDEIVDSSIEEQNPLVKTPIVQHAISMGAKIKKNK